MYRSGQNVTSEDLSPCPWQAKAKFTDFCLREIVHIDLGVLKNVNNKKVALFFSAML